MATIEWGNSELLKRVSRARLSVALDSVGSVELCLALAPEQTLDLGQVPAQASFRVGDKGVFRGELFSVQTLSQRRFKLVYRDVLALWSHQRETDFPKNQTLQQVLEFFASEVGLKPRFFGDFSDLLPAYDRSRQCYQEQVANLAGAYGFWFAARGFSEELCFFRVGAHGESQQVVAEAIRLPITQLRAAAPLYKSAQLSAFDPQTRAREQTDWEGGSLYEGLSATCSGESRERWQLAQGKYEQLASSMAEYAIAQTALPKALSKQALGSQQLRWQTSQWVGHPGDKIEFPAVAGQSKWVSGSYLLQSAEVELIGAHTRCTFTGIRV